MNGRGGFTLLELVIALTIVAVIVVIVFGALRIGIRAWEKGEKDLDTRQRQRIVLDLIKHQLASTAVTEVWGTDGQLVSLKGDSKSIAFVSHIPLTPGRGFGTVYVRYIVKHAKEEGKEQLTFAERNVTPSDKKRSAPERAEGDVTELISGVKSIVFEYLKERPGEAVSFWQKSWDPAVDRGLPRAVRMTFLETDDSAPVYVTAGVGG